jgi:hypothetical protein
LEDVQICTKLDSCLLKVGLFEMARLEQGGPVKICLTVKALQTFREIAVATAQ